MNILFLEPFYGGSHKDFAQGFAEHSAHEVDIVTLPPRFWKWRMRGASLYFLQQIDNWLSYDLIFATDMMDLADFKALAGPECPPIVFYFHENQISYPLGPNGKKDSHLGFTNIISAAAADAVIFNSRFHRDDFFEAARLLVNQMPDTRPKWIMDAIEEKSSVIYPGCRFSFKKIPIRDNDLDRPLIVWNHRWEYDKNPDLFFKTLAALKSRGVKFYLALMGEQYTVIPKVFERAKDDFREELLTYGYQESGADYRGWLSKGTVVVSTAIQENFGISVMEAIAHGCFPILPNRLSYPELIPKQLHDSVIYSTDSGLETKLEQVLTDPYRFLSARRTLADHASGFSWEVLIQDYDRLMEALIIA